MADNETARLAVGASISRSRLLHVATDLDAQARIEKVLSGDGFDFLVTSSSKGCLLALMSARVDLLIIDSELSGALSGLELSQRARSLQPWIGVLMLTSEAGASARVRALESGCDDCLTKPYELNELVARSRSIARRVARTSSAGIATWGSLEVDLVRGTARAHGELIELQPLQLRLLGYLLLNAGRLVAREELRQNVFRTAQHARSTSIARQISVLRERLGQSAPAIVTLPGGYGLGIDTPCLRKAGRGAQSFPATPSRFIQRYTWARVVPRSRATWLTLPSARSSICRRRSRSASGLPELGNCVALDSER